jgi:hypothetical protein
MSVFYELAIIEVFAAFYIVLLMWMNKAYERIYGHRLRLRYSWAAHGLLLFQNRARAWEEQE